MTSILPPEKPRRRWPGRLLLLLLGAHVVLGVFRLPGKVWGRRLDDIAEYRQKGAARYLLECARLSGADVVEWILQHAAVNTAVLWRGTSRGSLELVPGLLAPRLVVAEDAVPAGATSYQGRTLATGTLPSGQHGVLVVEGRGDTLGLAVR
jgi:hypothetical protein